MCSRPRLPDGLDLPVSGLNYFNLHASPVLPSGQDHQKATPTSVDPTSPTTDGRSQPRWWTMIAVTALSLALAADGGYPLAAAFALADGGVVIAFQESRLVTPVNTAGLFFSSADLAPNMRTLIGTARSPNNPTDRMYRLDQVDSKTDNPWVSLSIAPKGAPRTPRFTPSGKSVVFAASHSSHSDQSSPTQLWRQTFPSNTSPRTTRLTSGAACHFSPSALDNQQTAEISTNCISEFNLSIARPDGSSAVLSQTTAAFDEVAASFDGRTIVVSRRLDGEQVFSVHRGGEIRRIYSFRLFEPGPVQPRFVCPRDLMFLENGVPRILNTQDGGVQTVEASTR